MSPTELIEQLKHLTTKERLAVVEAAMQFIREDLAKQPDSLKGDDPLLNVIGCLSGRSLSAEEIETELYGKEGD